MDVKKAIKDWMLPGALVAGVSLYFIYRAITPLHQFGHTLGILASESQRFLIGVLLFLQFVRISPHDLRLTRWHAIALGFQILTFIGCAAIVVHTEPGDLRIMVECAMLCLICPAASAAGVITDKLGGSLAGTVTYNVLSNAAATLLIPMIIPAVHPSEALGFWAYVGHIALKVFPVLILPALLAWLIRYTMPRLQRRLMRLSPYAFYVWGVCLTLAMTLATRALVLSRPGAAALACIVLVSLGCCALQFYVGRHIGRDTSERITSGQSLGQKNTGFLIWLGYNYLTPVTSVAGGLYAIWQNLFNSWELYRSNQK